MIRRLTALVILSLTVSALAAPLAALAACPATGPMSCCRHAASAEEGPSVSAGSCCRFEACEPETRQPGVVPSTVRAPTLSVALAVLPAPALLTAAASGALPPPLAPGRSPDSPVSLHTTLRL